VDNDCATYSATEPKEQSMGFRQRKREQRLTNQSHASSGMLANMSSGNLESHTSFLSRMASNVSQKIVVPKESKEEQARKLKKQK
jgi:hypothetical protein